jgi:uncharacterized protein
MTQIAFRPDRLDVRAFAQHAAQLEGHVLLSKCERLAQDLYSEEPDFASKAVHWKARGESAAVSGGVAQSWLHLSVSTDLPLPCQRCLQAMHEPVDIERSFRFVRDEEEAAAQDEDANEDLLVAAKQFDLLALIEDELIMAMPFAPAHDVCPVPVKLSVSSEEYEAALNEKPKAFAALGDLKSRTKSG